MRLAQRGYRVLLLDRAKFPSDTMSTLYLQPEGIAALSRWGLLEAVVASGCPAIRTWRWGIEELTLEGFPWTPDGRDCSYAPRRTILDPLLLQAAARAGAEVREQAAFNDVVRDDTGRVIGVRGTTTTDGTAFVEHARVVIGADGMHSRVAKAVGAARYVDKPGLIFGYYAFWSGVPADAMETYIRDGRMALFVPTNDALTLVWVGEHADRFPAFRADVEGNYLRGLDAIGQGARVRAGKREERFIGTAETPMFFRQSHGDGWALVGDAAYHKDPITAQGISDAFRYAELLADAIHAGLAGERPLADALADYQRRRDELAMPLAEWTYRQSALKPPTEGVKAMLRALADRPEEVSRFMGLNAGTVSPTEFFTPANVTRILSARPSGRARSKA
jgi:flavin-dependent dehydrogenase